MIWTKTAIGRAEIGARALVHERARRNLLLLIDGLLSQDTLLASVAGIGPEDFDQLARLGLIARAPAGSAPAARPASSTVPLSKPASLASRSTPSGGRQPAQSYGLLTEKLTQMISSELGLRGFRLTLAVEKAADVSELEPVAERVLAEIAKRKGGQAAESARRRLYSA
ncbi:MAG: hypothetical protein Q7T97_18670 [Burkholderiaceae bacterium]|nr:hypothetical protein [Burkholderiaceae bacterium]